ncbi:hypothetical protein N7475_009535 [Penicillium sp. IBT 31633x]|nr:hypothetical protein N7475_009535 [Penicillium sp. IBT 31633x]
MDPRNCMSLFWFPPIAATSTVYQSLPSLLELEMSEDSGVQFMGARTKRTPRGMAAENDRSGEDVWQQHFHPPPDSARSQSTRLPPRRPRDGYDYRRPAILSSANDVVIDLTNEPESPPQEHTASFPGPLQTPHPHRPRLRFPRDIMNQTSPVADHPPVIDLEAEPSSGPVDVSSSSGDVLYIGTSSVRPGPIEPRWLDNNGMPMHYRRHAQRPRGLQHGPSRRVLRGPLYPTDDDAISIMSSLPGRLNYGIPAFPYQPPSQSVSRGRQNLYRSPSPPKEGFTRIMGEENMATCPNCQGELGAGEGLKQEVYIAKPCGHAYCGECATNRAISKSKKAASKTKPFSKCQVEGCNKSLIPPTAMYHLFL